MPSIGDALRQRRVQGQQTVSEAARASGLPKRTLIGFESGAVSLDDTKDLAYLRIYARYLGLDAEELLRSLRYRTVRPPVADQRAGRWRAKQGGRVEGLAPPFSRPPPSAPSARRWVALALLGAVIVAVTVAASVVLLDGLAVQSIVPTAPFVVVDRTALEVATA